MAIFYGNVGEKVLLVDADPQEDLTAYLGWYNQDDLKSTVATHMKDVIKDKYDYVLIDCMPSLGMLTINSLASANYVIVPVQSQYIPAKEMGYLLQTIGKVRGLSRVCQYIWVLS